MTDTSPPPDAAVPPAVPLPTVPLPTVPLHVEVGPADTVHLCYGDMLLPLPSEAAALLGRALIAAATANRGAEPPATGFHVVDAHLPVTAWRIGISKANLEPVLMFEVTGGLWLSFQLNAGSGKEIAAAMTVTVSANSRQPGQLLI
jgi:hypothetical protein